MGLAYIQALDKARIQWSLGDIIENRPALSRWHPECRFRFQEAPGLHSSQSKHPLRSLSVADLVSGLEVVHAAVLSAPSASFSLQRTSNLQFLALFSPCQLHTCE